MSYPIIINLRSIPEYILNSVVRIFYITIVTIMYFKFIIKCFDFPLGINIRPVPAFQPRALLTLIKVLKLLK